MGYGMQIPTHKLGGPIVLWDTEAMGYLKYGLREVLLQYTIILCACEHVQSMVDLVLFRLFQLQKNNTGITTSR